MIRTNSGEFFESFVNHSYVAIGHEEIPYKKIADLKKFSKSDRDFKNTLKDYVSEKIKDKQPGLIAGQLSRFVYDVKRGDIVVAPSENSDFIAIGEITETPILETSDLDLTRTECPFRKRKKVRWIKTIAKSAIDPLFYKVLQSHQAINNISHYANIIQRSIGDFYKLEGKTNLIVNVRRKQDIKANDLMFFGSDLLRVTQDFIDKYGLEVDTADVDIKININSEGKSQFLSKKGNIILVLGLVIIGLGGGGLKFKSGGVEFDLSTNGIISEVNDFLNDYHDRKMVEELMHTKKSLEISNNEDLLRYLKQFSTNKDLPK